VAAVGVFAVYTLMQQLLTPPPPEAAVPTPVTDRVVITGRSIQLGTVLTYEDLIIAEVPVELAPLNRLNDLNVVVGRITTIPLVAGEMVLPHHLADQTNLVDRNLAFNLEDDQVLMAFPIVDLMGQINILKKGDIVDILVSLNQEIQTVTQIFTGEEETETKLFTFDALQRLTITAVVVDYVSGAAPTAIAIPGPEAEATPQPLPEPSRGESNPVAIMLALSPQDALVLKHLKDSGAIFDLVLRSPTSTLYFETVPVTSDYITERYELQIIR
jgi:pilus assembly protein CpaB